METKNILFGVIAILALLLIRSTFSGENQQQTQSQETAQFDLCNEISIPSAAVHCGMDPDSVQRCYLVVSGDSRVDYEYGILGGGWRTCWNSTCGSEKRIRG